MQCASDWATSSRGLSGPLNYGQELQVKLPVPRNSRCRRVTAGPGRGPAASSLVTVTVTVTVTVSDGHAGSRSSRPGPDRSETPADSPADLSVATSRRVT